MKPLSHRHFLTVPYENVSRAVAGVAFDGPLPLNAEFALVARAPDGKLVTIDLTPGEATEVELQFEWVEQE